MARVLMLDIGGVFYRSWPDEEFWPRWSVRTGLKRAELEDWLSSGEDARLARLGHISPAAYYARAAHRYGSDPDTFKTLLDEAYLADFDIQLADFIWGLKARGVPIWALTNSLSTEAQWMRRPGFEGMFQGVISSCDCGLAKPDRAIFDLAARRAGAEPQEIVFVDDILSHVEAAQSVGFDAIHFEETAKTIAELARRW